MEWYSAADGYKNPVTRDRKDKTQQLCCDEDTSASLYLKNGGYFGIFPYEEINVKEMPKQAEVAAIIYSDSCGYNVWAEDFNQIHIFVTYEEQPPPARRAHVLHIPGSAAQQFRAALPAPCNPQIVHVGQRRGRVPLHRVRRRAGRFRLILGGIERAGSHDAAGKPCGSGSAG